MNTDAVVLLLLAVCCVAAAVAQAAEWRPIMMWPAAIVLAASLIVSGELASRTSLAEVVRWAATFQRRQDLAALLLAEALLFGSHAVRLAQGDASTVWRRLGTLPPPSFLLALFFAQVGVMLTVDGLDYGALSWSCAIAFALVFAAATISLRWVLRDTLPRSVLRVGLYGAQVIAGIWLARPPFVARVDPVPLWGDRLATVTVLVTALVLLGWLLQRRRIEKN